MHDKHELETKLNKRQFEKTDIQALNNKIFALAKQTPQSEFNSSIVKVSNSAKILAITACFILGIFTGFSLDASAVTSEEIDYIYIEEGIL